MQLLPAFAVLTVLAVGLGRRSPAVRRAYLLIFLALVLLAGLRGKTKWPFFHWNLFAERASTRVVFHEFRVADQEGRELRYDARAVSPSLPTSLRRLAGSSRTSSAANRAELAQFLIASAEEYRRQISERSAALTAWLKFPSHQFGYRWNRNQVTELGPLCVLRTYQCNLTFSPDGRRLFSREDALAWEYSSHVH